MFPKRKYAKSGGHIVINSEHEERQLGDGWCDNPPGPPTPPVDDPPPSDPPPSDPPARKKGK